MQSEHAGSTPARRNRGRPPTNAAPNTGVFTVDAPAMSGESFSQQGQPQTDPFAHLWTRSRSLQQTPSRTPDTPDTLGSPFSSSTSQTLHSPTASTQPRDLVVIFDKRGARSKTSSSPESSRAIRQESHTSSLTTTRSTTRTSRPTAPSYNIDDFDTFQADIALQGGQYNLQLRESWYMMEVSRDNRKD